MFEKRRDTNDHVTSPLQSQSPVASASTPNRPASPKATIGPTIVVNGKISGDEAMVIAGRCEGSISLPQNTLTILSGGHVRANVEANVVEIEGQVEGDVDGVDKVVITATGRMEGNIKAPRVILNDGAKFKGSIDMDPGTAETAKAAPKRVTPDKVKLTGDGRPVEVARPPPAAASRPTGPR